MSPISPRLMRVRCLSPWIDFWVKRGLFKGMGRLFVIHSVAISSCSIYVWFCARCSGVPLPGLSLFIQRVRLIHVEILPLYIYSCVSVNIYS